VLLASMALGSVMDSLSDAASPYMDAATTVSALLATWMVAQRLLENWLYWIAIDLASVGLYLSRDLTLTAEAERALLSRRWPGNVRQLQNEMQRVAALANGPQVFGADLTPER